MIFNSWEFAIFGTITYAVYWFTPRPAWRPWILAISGIVFYAASIPTYTLLIIALGAVSFIVSRELQRTAGGAPAQRRLLLIGGISASVAVLLFFKYAHFLATAIRPICPHGCLNTIPDLIVPLAISFFTFEFVHVIVDAYLGKTGPITLRDFVLFTLFFPTMVAGPIKRYQNFVPQIDAVRPLRALVVTAAGYRILLGLAKKTIIADSMTSLVLPITAPDAIFTRLDYVVATLAYTVKIYFDFTGYSDIAIGLAQLLGYNVPENFERPYRASDISQFWRCWHISLSSWIRDYLFIPIGGSRRKGWAAINLLFVMAIAGLWHGAAWHFVAWGLWHGTGLAAHRLWSRTVAGVYHLPKLTAGILTFSFVSLGWVLFAAPTVGAAGNVYAQIFHLAPSLLGGRSS